MNHKGHSHLQWNTAVFQTLRFFVAVFSMWTQKRIRNTASEVARKLASHLAIFLSSRVTTREFCNVNSVARNTAKLSVTWYLTLPVVECDRGIRVCFGRSSNSVMRRNVSSSCRRTKYLKSLERRSFSSRHRRSLTILRKNNDLESILILEQLLQDTCM